MTRVPFVVAIMVVAAAAAATEPAGRAMLPTCPGRGYVPYAYPAFGSCPCGEDGCFLPGRYYACCGEADPNYKKSFWSRWRKALFCGGSMLDGVPCHCIYPPGCSVAAPLAVPQSPAGHADARVLDPASAASRTADGVEPNGENLDAVRQKP